MTARRREANAPPNRPEQIRAAAIVVAAGSGSRLRGPVAKSLRILGDKPLFAHAVTAFEGISRIRDIILVVPAQGIPLARHWVESLQLIKVIAVVPGGKERGDSVQEGLNALASDVQWVAIHDGARPFVSADLIDRALDAALKVGGAIPVVPLTDTIKEVSDGRIKGTIDRATLGGAQTPQVFLKERLLEAYRLASDRGIVATDDAQIVQQFTPGAIAAVPGDERNFKVTTVEDWLRAEDLWNRLHLQRGFHSADPSAFSPNNRGRA